MAAQVPMCVVRSACAAKKTYSVVWFCRRLCGRCKSTVPSEYHRTSNRVRCLTYYTSAQHGSKNSGDRLTSHFVKSGATTAASQGDQHQNASGKSSESKSKTEDFSRRAMKYTFIAFGTLCASTGGLLVWEWGSPRKDENGKIIKDEFSDMPVWKAYILRTYKEIRYYDKMIKDPSREKLLPDPLTEPYYQPPYTLVLEMTGVLVHPDWTYQTGWRFKKRPGLDFFLQQVGPPLFEIVVYTSEQVFTAFPILDSLDPQGYITYRLFRDATRYLSGHHVKDLSCLNRDLSKVIFIDWDEKSYQLQPENALRLKKWKGNDDDRTLLELSSFLRTIATSGVEDVRTVMSFYKEFDDPLQAFKENQEKAQKEQEWVLQRQEEQGKGSSLAGLWRGSLRKKI